MRGRTIVIAVGAAFLLGLCMVTAVGAYFLTGLPWGSETEAQRTVSSFERIDMSAVGNLIVTRGEVETVQIDAPQRIRSRIRTEVRGDTLHIWMRGFGPFGWFGVLPNIGDVTYHVTMRDLRGIAISGAGSVQIDQVQAAEFDVDSSGTSNITIASMDTERLTVELSGAGSLEVTGRAAQQFVDISGTGRYTAGDLQSQSASVELSGAGNATVWVEEDLDVDISGVGNVDYYGSPQLSQEISGMGDVDSLGEHSP